MRSGKPCIEISREELLALSLTLGITLYINDFTQNVRGLGPFGTGLNIVQDNGEWKLEMVHGARLPRHRASKGSGYTPLFAKHIAFGSLPFADAKNWVRSVFVNDGVLEAIKRGDSIIDGRSFGGRPLQILKRLPGSKSIDAYYHWSSADKLNLQPGFKHRLGHFYDTTKTIPVMMRPQKGAAGTSTKSPVYSSPSTLPNNTEGKDAAIEMAKLDEQDENLANWTRTVTGIAFGGLVPQSSSNLAQAVQFTVGEIPKPSSQRDEVVNRKEVEDLINAIEDLVNQIQTWDSRRVPSHVPHDGREFENSEMPFGDYVAERAPSEESIDNVYYAAPLKYHDTQEAAASFARYMNLLERIVALYHPGDIPEKTESETQEKVKLIAQEAKVAEKPNLASNFLKYGAYISTTLVGRSKSSLDKPWQTVETPDHSDKVEIVFEESCRYLQTVYVAAVKHHQQNPQNGSAHLGGSQLSFSEHHPTPHMTLSEHVQLVSNKISQGRREFSRNQQRRRGAQNDLNPGASSPLFEITLHDCVLIVRCILVIWANQVPKVRNADASETDSELLADAQLGGTLRGAQGRVPTASHPASLMDLPQVMAFA
jgi:hypothetical protein